MKATSILRLRALTLNPRMPRFWQRPATELTALVLESDVPDLIGRRVIVHRFLACGACRWCHANRPDLCAAPEYPPPLPLPRTDPLQLPETFSFPTRFLYPLPDSIREYDALLVYPLASALRLRQIIAGRLLRTVILGSTAETIVCGAALRNITPRPFISRISDGIYNAFARHQVLQDPGGRFPIVVDTSFSAAGIASAMRRIEPGGTLVLAHFGLPLPPVDLSYAAGLEVSVVFVSYVPLEDALAELADRDLCGLLAKARPHVFPLRRAAAAFDQLGATSMRVVLDNLDS